MHRRIPQCFSCNYPFLGCKIKNFRKFGIASRTDKLDLWNARNLRISLSLLNWTRAIGTLKKRNTWEVSKVTEYERKTILANFSKKPTQKCEIQTLTWSSWHTAGSLCRTLRKKRLAKQLSRARRAQRAAKSIRCALPSRSREWRQAQSLK